MSTNKIRQPPPLWKRALCGVGVHLEGRKGLGMYGDANACNLCGKDAYGLLVIKESSEAPDPEILARAQVEPDPNDGPYLGPSP